MKPMRILLAAVLGASSVGGFYAQEKPSTKTVKAVRFGKHWDAKGKLWTDAGVTTVRDLGADQYMDIAMRDLINRGEMIGPRMFVCGYGLYITNTPYKPGLNPPAGGVADGVPEVLKAVRQQIAAGADVIKMYGSTGTDDDVTGFETYTYEEMKAAVEMTHQFGKKIAIHSYGPNGARDAVRAGTDSLEHATDL